MLLLLFRGLAHKLFLLLLFWITITKRNRKFSLFPAMSFPAVSISVLTSRSKLFAKHISWRINSPLKWIFATCSSEQNLGNLSWTFCCHVCINVQICTMYVLPASWARNNWQNDVKLLCTSLLSHAQERNVCIQRRC